MWHIAMPMEEPSTASETEVETFGSRMAENLDKWPSKRVSISKIRPLDSCQMDAVPLPLECHYNGLDSGIISQMWT